MKLEFIYHWKSYFKPCTISTLCTEGNNYFSPYLIPQVESVFTLSLEHLCSAKNQRYTKFKHLGVSIMKRPVFVNGPHRIWGLTAIVLDVVMATFCPEFYQKMFEIKGHGLR